MSEQLLKKIGTYWTGRAAGYSKVNQEELAGTQRRDWLEHIEIQIQKIWKDREKQSIHILDVGTGSGILGIAAVKLGAREGKGTDLDENAITAVKENLEANGIPKEQFQVIQGNILEDKGVQDWAGYEQYDIAVANILADVIIPLQKEIPAHIQHGGVFIASGIINMKEEAVLAAFAENKEFEVLEVTRQGEWVSVTARRK